MRSESMDKIIVGNCNMARKGRNRELIRERDQKILERFIYWTEDQRLRSDDAVVILSKQEFFLSEQRIIRILNTAYSQNGRKVQVVFHQPKPPKLTQAQKDLLSK